MSDRELCDEITIIDAGDYRRILPSQRVEQRRQDHSRRKLRRESGS
jgi:DNA replication protein DnaC